MRNFARSLPAGGRCSPWASPLSPRGLRRFTSVRRSRPWRTCPEQDALEFELQFPHGVRLDILTPRDPAGSDAIARFLARAGEGIQQVECEVRDVTRATQLLRERFALEPVYPETRAGADGTRINFFLVPTTEGRKVLIELVESPQDKNRRVTRVGHQRLKRRGTPRSQTHIIAGTPRA